MDFNPDALKFLAEFPFGGAGTTAVRAYDAVANAMAEKEVGAADIPIARRFRGRVRHYQDVSQFYERRERIGQYESQAASFPRNSMPRRKFEKKNEALLDMSRDAKRTAKNLTRKRKLQRAAQANKMISESDRQKKLKQLDAEVKTIVAEFNRKYNETVEGVK